MSEIADQGPMTALLDRRSDDELSALMSNLGGQCLETLTQAFDAAGATYSVEDGALYLEF